MATCAEGEMTYFLPTTGPPTPRVLNKQMARTHLRRPLTVRTTMGSREVLFRAGEVGDLLLGETGRGLPHGFAGLGVVEVRHAARVGETDFPARLHGEKREHLGTVIKLR